MSEVQRHEPSITEWRQQETMIRIEEQMKQVRTDIANMQKVIESESASIRKDMATKTELKPVKAIAYGLVSLAGTGLFGLFFKILADASTKH